MPFRNYINLQQQKNVARSLICIVLDSWFINLMGETKVSPVMDGKIRMEKREEVEEKGKEEE